MCDNNKVMSREIQKIFFEFWVETTFIANVYKRLIFCFAQMNFKWQTWNLNDYLIEVSKNLVEYSHTFYTLIIRIQFHVELREVADGSK